MLDSRRGNALSSKAGPIALTVAVGMTAICGTVAAAEAGGRCCSAPALGGVALALAAVLLVKVARDQRRGDSLLRLRGARTRLRPA